MSLQPRTFLYAYHNKLLCFHTFGGFWNDHRKDFPRTRPQNTGNMLTYIQAPSGIQTHESLFGAIENIMYGYWCTIATFFVKNNLQIEISILTIPCYEIDRDVLMCLSWIIPRNILSCIRIRFANLKYIFHFLAKFFFANITSSVLLIFLLRSCFQIDHSNVFTRLISNCKKWGGTCKSP
jgi:hypothetical protein